MFRGQRHSGTKAQPLQGDRGVALPALGALQIPFLQSSEDVPGHPRLPSAALAVLSCLVPFSLQKNITVNSQTRGLLFPFSKHQKDLEHLPVVTVLALPQLPPSLQHRCPGRRARCAPSCSVPHHGAHPSKGCEVLGFDLCAGLSLAALVLHFAQP